MNDSSQLSHLSAGPSAKKAVPQKNSATRTRIPPHSIHVPFTLALIVLILGLLGSSCKNVARREAGRLRTISTVCLLDGPAYRNKNHALELLNKVEKSTSTHLTVLPFIPFLSFRTGHETEDLVEFFELARWKMTYLVIALTEKAEENRAYHSALLISPQGQVLGKYRKSHRVAWDDDIALGNDLPVFETPFGKIGLTIGSDFYFPEIYEVLRMKGAEVLVWQHFPERLREHYQWLPLLYARAMDSHAFLVTAHYADPRTYITNNYDYGMKGAAFGRSMVIDRSGTARADTGYRHGVASLTLDLDERKVDVYPMTPNFENLFYVPNNGGRAAFKPIAEPWQKPKLSKFERRQARIAVAYASGEEMWRDGAYPATIFELLQRAWEYKPDLVLFSENGIRKPEHPEVRRGLDDISRWAAAHRCYVVIGGIGGEEFPNGAARIWDRSGRLVYSQPLYWPAGAETLKVLDTDFARIATHTCGDLHHFPIDRVLALQGAELILDPSQMWGPDGYHNDLLLRARAVDNGCYIACAHWNTSDPGLRSVIVDPYGGLIASSGYQKKGVIFADIDFSQEKIYYAGLSPNQPQPKDQDIPNYFTPDFPEVFSGWRDMIFGSRRPELYGLIPTENEVTRRYISKELQKQKEAK
jgi:predicted amidohydrolase